MPNAPKYSIVVPAYNAAGMLERLLASFERLEGCGDAEFLIVDDCSTDDTAAIADAWIAKGLPFAARCVRLEKNSGPGAARNAGLEAARGEYIAFTDTDCVVEPDWLIALVRALDPGRNIMAVGGKVLPLSRKSIFARYNTVNETLEPFHAYKSPPSYVVTCNCCYVRAALVDSGGFPVDVRVPGGEDVGASIRMHHRGYRCAFTPKAVLYHDYRESFRKFVRTWRNYGYGCAYTTHTTLSRDELNPQRPPRHDNDWWIINVFPTVTGLWTLVLDLKLYISLGRLRGFSWWAIISTYPLRPFERFAYYIGWLEGLSAAKIARPELNDWL